MTYRLDIVGTNGLDQTFSEYNDLCDAMQSALDQGATLQVDTIPDAQASSPTEGAGDTPPEVDPSNQETDIDEPATDSEDSTDTGTDEDDDGDTSADPGDADSEYVDDSQG